MKLILLGPPGSGKGTMGDWLERDFSHEHISTGEMFREEMNNETELGILAKSFINKGQLVPDEVTIKMLKSRVENLDNFTLDGFPRTVTQAEAIEDIQIDLVINLEVSEDVVIERFAGRRKCSKCHHGYHTTHLPPKVEDICDIDGSPLIQRDDDKPEVVKARFKEYEKKTAPLIDYYKSKGILKNVDAAPLPKDVYESVKEVLKNV